MFGDPVTVLNDVPVSLRILLKPFADHPELRLWRVGLVYSADTTTNKIFLETGLEAKIMFKIFL